MRTLLTALPTSCLSRWVTVEGTMASRGADTSSRLKTKHMHKKNQTLCGTVMWLLPLKWLCNQQRHGSDRQTDRQTWKQGVDAEHTHIYTHQRRYKHTCLRSSQGGFCWWLWNTWSSSAPRDSRPILAPHSHSLHSLQNPGLTSGQASPKNKVPSMKWESWDRWHYFPHHHHPKKNIHTKFLTQRVGQIFSFHHLSLGFFNQCVRVNLEDGDRLHLLNSGVQKQVVTQQVASKLRSSR